jgi:hypothetical protein
MHQYAEVLVADKRSATQQKLHSSNSVWFNKKKPNANVVKITLGV